MYGFTAHAAQGTHLAALPPDGAPRAAPAAALALQGPQPLPPSATTPTTATKSLHGF